MVHVLVFCICCNEISNVIRYGYTKFHVRLNCLGIHIDVNRYAVHCCITFKINNVLGNKFLQTNFKESGSQLCQRGAT